MKRRFLSTLMALVLALSLIPTAAFAEEGEEISALGETETSESETMELTDTLDTSAVTMTQNETAASYDTIKAAIVATSEYDSSLNKGQYTITLNQDLTEDVVIPANHYIKIDLNGHTLTNVSDHTITNNSTRTYIVDTSEDKRGVVDNISHGKGAVYNNINANITLQGGTYTRSAEASTGSGSGGDGGNSWYVLKNFGTMTINSGVTVKFSDDNNGRYSSLIGNGWQNSGAAESGNNGEPKPSEGENQAKLTINGGTFTGGQITIKNDDYGVLSITGGDFTQPSEDRYAVYNANTATISGGTFTSQATVVGSDHFDGGANTGKLTISKGTFSSENGSAVSVGAGADLTLSGGTFQTKNESAYVIGVAETATAEVSGGSFPGATETQVVNNTSAFKEGYGVVTNQDGTVSVGVTDESAEAVVIARDGSSTNYLTLSAAAKAAPAGSNIRLQNDVVLTSGVSTVNYGVTIDLNGHNIDGTAVTSSDGAVVLKTNYSSKPVDGVDSTMRLINSVSGQGGTIKAKLPVSVKAGDSKIPLPAEIGENVTLQVLEGGTDAVKLSSSAYLNYSETAAGYIKNGGFKVTASDGDRIYGIYANAAGASSDGVVTLMNDYTGSEKISSGSHSSTLNLAGKTYTYTGSDTIVDVNYDNVSLTIQNGNLMGTNAESDGVHMLNSNSGFILEGGTIDVKGDNAYGIVTNGQEVNNTVTLKYSTLNVPNGYGIYFPSTGKVTIENSVINAKYVGVQLCAGSLTVTGEQTSITVTEEPQTKTENDGVIPDGAAISIVERDGYQDLGTVTITDGTFKAADSAKAVKAYTFNNDDRTEGDWEDADKTVSVSGGTFSTGVAAYVVDGKYSVGGTDGMFTVKDTEPANAIQDDEGNYYESADAAQAGSVASITNVSGTIYYTSFEEAMNNLTVGDTLNLWKDVNPLSAGNTAYNNAVITLPAGVTLNGHNHTITAGTWALANEEDPQFHILGVADIAGGEENRVTVKNLTIVGNETTKHGFNAYGSTNTPEVTLDNVTIRNCGTAAVVVNRAKVTAKDLKTSGNVWGAVNVDKSGTFTLQGNANSMAEDAQIWTEIADSEINVSNSNYGNLQKVTGGDGDLAGKTYYTDDPAKLGEATVEKDDGTVTVYEDLDNALKEENLTDTETVTVVDNATLNDSATIPSGVTLVVNQGVTLTIPSSVTLTNKGTIENHGKIEGTVTGDTEALTSAVTFVTTPSYATVTVTGQTPASGKTYNLTDGNYSYTVSASGYVTVTGTFTVSGNAQTIPVILTAISTDSSSGGSSDPSYSPVLDVSNGGTIKVTPRTPSYGDKVTITPDPDRGYEVDEVIVRDRNGNRVDVTAERNGTYTFEQPRGRVTIEVTFVPTGTATFFTDVPASFWAYDEIKWAYDNGYVNGTSATTFSPNASISRQQVWMILARLSGQSPANMAEARTWAMENGISDGTTPGNAVTRQQLVALLYRYATMMGYANDARADLTSYPDAGTVASYAVEPMQWSVANSIVAGTSDGTLNPTGTATRAQFAVILYRFMNQG